jgi:hypothetical protein
VTKYRLKPSGDRIAFSFVEGRRVALTRVARGTKPAVSGISKRIDDRVHTSRKRIGE